MGAWGVLTLALIAISAVMGLAIDTSRQSMVSEENAHSARYQSYLRDFGTPLHLAVVVEGDDPRGNKRVAEAIANELRGNSEWVKGVMVRASFEEFRQFIPLFLSDEARTKLTRWLDQANDPDRDSVAWRSDNCPWVSNPNQADGDSDGVGDACSMDWDNDGVADDSDPCPAQPGASKEACRGTQKNLRLVDLFAAGTRTFECMEEGDLGVLAPYETLLKTLREDLSETENTAEFEDLVSGIERAFLEDGWTELSGPSNSKDETGRMAASGLDEEGYFTAEEGRLVFLFVQPMSDSDAGSDVIPFVEYVEGVIERNVEPGVSALATGNPAFVAEEMSILQRDVILTALVAGLGVLLLFLWVYRSIQSTIAVFLPLLAGIVGCLGFTSIVYGNLNLISSSMFAIIVGLGIDFGIHLFARFQEALDEVSDRKAAVLMMMESAGPGVLTGGITTISAFLCLNVSEFHGMKQLGVLSAVGLFLILIANFTLLPCLLVELTGIGGKRKKETRGEGNGDGLVDRLLGLPTRHAKAVLVGIFAISVFWALQINQFTFSFDVKEFLPQDTPARQAYDRLVSTNAFTPDFAVMVSPSLEDAREKTERLMEKPELIARVQSAATFLPLESASTAKTLSTLRDSYTALKARWPDLQGLEMGGGKPSSAGEIRDEIGAISDGLEMDLPFFLAQHKDRLKKAGVEVPDSAKMHRRWAEMEKRVEALPEKKLEERIHNVETRLLATLAGLEGFMDSTRLSMRPADLPEDLKRSFWREKEGGQEVFALQIFPTQDIMDSEFMDEFLAHTQGIDPDVTGLPVTFLAFGTLLTEGLFHAVIYAFFIIFFVLFSDYRSLRPVLLTLFPLALGTLWMAGAMHWFKVDFNFANMMGLPLILGIGVDSGVHLVHRYRQGISPSLLVKTTGKAVGLSSLTTMVGMGSMIVATHGGMHSLGIVLLIGVAACLVTSVVALPALLSLLERKTA